MEKSERFQFPYDNYYKNDVEVFLKINYFKYVLKEKNLKIKCKTVYILYISIRALHPGEPESVY